MSSDIQAGNLQTGNLKTGALQAGNLRVGDLQAGDILFQVELPPADRAQLAAFSEGTEDPNPIHVDEAFAQAAGFPTVLQQGPMTTAQFARLIEEHTGSGRLGMLDVFFTAPVFPGDSLVLSAKVTEIGEVIRCTLAAHKADGTQTAKGIAELRRQA